MEGGNVADTHAGNTLLMVLAVTMNELCLLLTAGSLDTLVMEYTGADEQRPKKIASVMPRNDM